MALGLQQAGVEPIEAATGYTIGQYEEDIKFSSETMEDGSQLRPSGTKRVFAYIWDSLGNRRNVHRTARQYHLDKFRIVNGKPERVFFENPPAHLLTKDGKLREKEEGVDFLSCPIPTCRHQCELDVRLRLPGAVKPERRDFALRVSLDRHIHGFHPEEYIYYADDEIRDRTESLAKGNRKK